MKNKNYFLQLSFGQGQTQVECSLRSILCRFSCSLLFVYKLGNNAYA